MVRLAIARWGVRFSLLWRYGASSSHDRLSDKELGSLLADLDDGKYDTEHGDVWLSEEATGRGIGVFAGDRGLVVLENTEPGGESFHRVGVLREDAFTLLRRFADGELGAIRGESWLRVTDPCERSAA
ncbi:hypothetical protein GCM10010109_20930 [Actinoplanes campanulatus]|nr:hypothetical protein GCM10010109_20930 [Actinoplanes campanulatus]GID36609.1 hypothetical protein Aca09nite_31150 [Actinoplanes campanulatus]